MPDPIRLELFRNLFESAAEEMGITLQRTAFSANIKERRDFSCALFDPAGNLLAQAAHIPVHLGSMPAGVAAVLDALGPLDEGDVAIVNDPFAGGSHLPDVTIITPIHYEDRPLGYAANRAHHADVGGLTPGSMTLSRHIDEEGFRIPPSFYCRRGVSNDQLIHAFLSSTRTPQERRGDLQAQLSANTVGRRAILRMADKFGPAEVLSYANALLDYSHAVMAATLRSLPNGRWSFADAMDDDGFSPGPIPLRCTLTIDAGHVTVDLRDVPGQVTGPINCPESVTRSAVYYCFACLLEDAVPLNAGCFRDIEVLTRPGSILHAEHPAPVVAGNTETSQRIVDLVFGCLAQVLPDRIPAASCGTMSSLALGGEGWTYYETIGGGSGASPGGPGEHAVQCHMTNTLNTPAEALELQYPLRVLRFERAPDTGGPGRHPGGDGIFRQLQALASATGTLLADRRRTRPYGLNAADHATPGQDAIHRAATRQSEPVPGKSRFTLSPGDILTIRTPGGGGWSPR